jgi:ketosteroid isomerase-like protein
MRFQASALAVLGLLAILSPAPSAWKAQGSDQAAEVEKLDRELSAAGVRDDVDASSRLIADEAIFVWDLNQSGKITTKADNLAGMKSPDYKLDSETFDEVHSKQFGDTVVIWGRTTAQGTRNKKPFRHSTNFTDVWQKHDGKWQQVFTRATPVAKPQ